MSPTTYTLLPGLHGTSQLFSHLATSLTQCEPDANIELIDYPTDIPQSYSSLLRWLEQKLDWTTPRVFIAESFSGPLAIQLAKLHPNSVNGLTLAASFCHNPAPASLALLPLRPIFSIRPPSSALRHFLLGENANSEEVDNLREIIKKTPKSALSQRIREILSLQETDCPKLPRIPILLLQAQHDNLVPWEAQTHMESHFPHAETHWIESPHLILQSHPTLCAKTIHQWVQNLHNN